MQDHEWPASTGLLYGLASETLAAFASNHAGPLYMSSQEVRTLFGG